MPLICPGGFDTCNTTLLNRERFRLNNTDRMSHVLRRAASLLSLAGAVVASPGYFSQTMDNHITMEATSTRRAGLERFTFPEGYAGSAPYFVLDLANDLPVSFAGGTLNIDAELGRITMGGQWGSRYASIYTVGLRAHGRRQLRSRSLQLSGSVSSTFSRGSSC